MSASATQGGHNELNTWT